MNFEVSFYINTKITNTQPFFYRFEATQRIRKIENNVNIKELYVHLPILAMTADVMQATQEECLKYGMDGYVSKPFEAEQLYREVSKFFQSS